MVGTHKRFLLFVQFFKDNHSLSCGVGQEGGSPGEKEQEAGEERAGSGSREKQRKIPQHFVIFCNRNGTKTREYYGKGREAGVHERYGKREVQTPLLVTTH